MANEKSHYDGNFPKKKINKTIIFRNSTMRKSNGNSKSNVSNNPKKSSDPKEHEGPSTERTSIRHFSSERQTNPIDNILMDSASTSSNILLSNPTELHPDIKEPTQFLFNFESKAAAGNTKLEKPNKSQNNSSAVNPETSALITKELCNATSKLSINNENTISNQQEDDINETNIIRDVNLLKKFDNIDVNTIYPEDLEGLFPPFSIQNRFGVWYCLICDVESLSFTTLKRHITTKKHGKAAKYRGLELNSYIDYWAAESEDCKKYQILINLGNRRNYLQCSKCLLKLQDNKCIEHMLICTVAKLKEHNNGRENVNIIKVPKENNVPIKAENSAEPTENTKHVSDAKVEENLPAPWRKQKEKNVQKRDPKSHQVHWLKVSPRWFKIIGCDLSTRFNKHLSFIERYNDDTILCIGCEMYIEFDIMQLLYHLSSKEHYDKCKLFKHYRTFICDVCDLECPTDIKFWCHRNIDDKHNAKVELLEDQDSSLCEYECITCKRIMFGQPVDMGKHMRAPVIPRKAKEDILVPTELDQEVVDLFKSRSHIEFIALELLKDADETKKLDYQLAEIIEDVENTLRSSFQKVKAYPFGSRVTGVCNKDSDLDVYIDINSNYYGNNRVNIINIIQQMKHVFQSNKDSWDDIVSIPDARTPIIRLRHTRTEVDVDISFQNGLSVENTKFIRFCLDLQPKLTPLILLLKSWLAKVKICKRFTTYALCILIIFKMQVDGHLIPVSYLHKLNAVTTKDGDQQLHSKQKLVTGWSFVDFKLSADQLQQYVVPITCDLTDLLKSFFEYYAAFDYTKMICPLLGQVLNMDEWFEDNVSILPDEMNIYKDKVYNGFLQHNMYYDRYSITVQDPFDMSHNLTKSVNKINLSIWKAYCQLSLDHLLKL